ARRLLEFEIAGRLLHPLFQVGDRGVQVVPDQRAVGEAGVDGDVIGLVDGAENVLDAAPDRGRGDAMRLVERLLLHPAPVGFLYRALHRAGDDVGVENHLAVDIAGGAADRLNERRLRAQKTLLVGVENGHQRTFRNVEPLAQKVDADQRVESAEAQIADDLDALDGVDVGVHVAHPDPVLVQVFGEVFGHALGQGGDQSAVTALRDLLGLAHEVVDLAAGGADLDRRIDEAGRANDLLDEDAAGLFELPVPRRRRDADRLWPHRLPFLEAQRPVVHAGGQAEAVFGQGRLAAVVAAVHAADLRDRHVALVDEHQRVVGQVFEQGRRRLARPAPGEISGIVLDAGAGAGRLEHFEVEYGALLEPLRLEQPALPIELVEPLLELLLDRLGRLQQRRARRHIVRIGVDFDEFEVLRLLAGKRIEFGDCLDLVAEEADAPGAVLVVGGKNLDRVAADPEYSAGEIAGGPLVLERDEVGDQLALVDPVAE